jgi:hypothetical protein
MADSPTTRTDTPPPPPPKPPEQRPTPDVQQKVDTMRAQREGNTAPRDQGGVKTADRTPSRGLEPSPEFQQKLDAFRAQKAAKQDAGQYVDHRPEKAQNAAARNTDRPAAGSPRAAESPAAQRLSEQQRTAEHAPEPKTTGGDNRLPPRGPGRPGSADTPPPPSDPGDRRVHQAQHLKPEADMRGKGSRSPDRPKTATEQTPSRDPARPVAQPTRADTMAGSRAGEGQPSDGPGTDRGETQRQGIRDAVAEAKTRRLENAVGFDQPPPVSAGEKSERPAPIVVIGSDQLFKSDYLDAVRRRMSENNEKGPFRMDPADVLNGDDLSMERIDALKAQGARIIDVGDGDPDVVDPWVKSRTDDLRARASAPLTPDSGDGSPGRYQHYLPMTEKYPGRDSRIMTGDMQDDRVKPAARDLGPDVHTLKAFEDRDHEPGQMAQNIAWTGKIALDNAGHTGPDGGWKPNTYTVGYSAEARNGKGPGDFSSMENELHRDLGAWRQAVDRGDNAVFPDPHLPPENDR